LLEIVFTIVIIGILLAIFLPVMSSIKLAAQKVKDQSNLRTIAAAWKECTINRGWIIDGESWGNIKAVDFAEQLAGRHRENISNIVLNDPYVWISPGDKYASKIQNEVISRLVGTSIVSPDPYSFSGVSNFMVSGGHLLSYCVICKLPGNIPLETTPLAFTRGLNKQGLWDEKSGLYGSTGGFVVFCDGHTVWFDGNNPAKFLKWDQSGYTNDIREAIPSDTWITCAHDFDQVRSDYWGENAKAIISAAGTGGS
jgi:type II secretory pathway pseudopilin PulG